MLFIHALMIKLKKETEVISVSFFHGYWILYLLAEIRVSMHLKKEESTTRVNSSFGAGSRGRTDTVLLPSDFESDASANSTIPAHGATIGRKMYYIIRKTKNQYIL